MRLKKKILRDLTYIILIATLFGCGNIGRENEDYRTSEKEKKEDTIAIPINDDMNGVNRDFSDSIDSLLATNIVYSPLYTYEKGNIKNYLAKDVKFVDDKIMTITLREELKWHDNVPIEAEDIIFTINTILDEKQKSPLRKYFIIDGQSIKTELKDNLTFQVILPTKVPSFLYEMSNVIPIPKHIYEGKGNILEYSKNNNPIGSGPFKLKEWKKGESITFTRFEEYFADKAKVDNIVLKVIPKKEDMERALENGEITLMRGSLNQFQKARTLENIQTFTYNGGRLNYIMFNENIDYMRNKDFRKAISYGLNRKEIIKSAYNDEISNEAKSILIPQADFYTEDIEDYEHNLSRAKEFMEKSKMKVKALKLGYNTERFAHKEYALAIQGQLRVLNIDVDIIPYDNNSFYKELFKNDKECDMYITGYNLGLSPNDYRYIYETGSIYNTSGYSNTEIDKLWDEGFKELNDEKRKNIYEKIQKLIADDAAIYTIDYEENLMIAKKSLRGLDEAIRSEGIVMFKDWSKLYIE
ncbi:ABC transporter substrate-binding protein [Clostridium cadaveris]|uniref:ABC transporter substrate-binding protein n=1 Tax=Clostridium cadaveris TaxID=1529 RepID=UPI001E631876|nr:ABC transporter substrate-binding protein [Clostridium cadaveris]UFH65186.1 ABC transporter substrate-binding protein [Clostridium cadaveris]